MTDSIDRRLIQLLQENAHQSSGVLAKQLGVSSSTIRRRINTLLQSALSISMIQLEFKKKQKLDGKAK